MCVLLRLGYLADTTTHDRTAHPWGDLRLHHNGRAANASGLAQIEGIRSGAIAQG